MALPGLSKIINKNEHFLLLMTLSSHERKEAYLEPIQTSKIKPFAKAIN